MRNYNKLEKPLGMAGANIDNFPCILYVTLYVVGTNDPKLSGANREQLLVETSTKLSTSDWRLTFDMMTLK